MQKKEIKTPVIPNKKENNENKTKQNKIQRNERMLRFFTPVVVSFVQPVSSDTQKIETTRKKQTKHFLPITR
jgi:hypothetical protein